MGDVDWLADKENILVSYGLLLPNEVESKTWTMVREFTHTDPAEIVWEIRLTAASEESKAGWTIFSAERIKGISN